MFDQIRKYYLNIIPRLQDDEWQALETCLTVQGFAKGEAVVKAGDVCNYVYFINKGFLRFYKLIDGRDISSSFIGANDYVSDSLASRNIGHIWQRSDCRYGS